MKIAVGIIALVLSMIALMQSCTVTGLGGLAENKAINEAGSIGMVTAFLMFFGGAFTFGLPKVARIFFVLSFLISLPAWADFPDMRVWGVLSAILALLLLFTGRKAAANKPEK